jgi:hypothetical protein
MVQEVRMVFDRAGVPLYWPHDPDASSVYLPESPLLWDYLWENRANIGGVAHTHPWNGEAAPSHTDVTTFSALERGLGCRLWWPIVTFTDAVTFEWKGPGEYEYGFRTNVLSVEAITTLRDLSLRREIETRRK